ncbi:MAG TPA: cysteine-rich CWC family protein [Steroidobacteraceae bacterium]|nr:cysteine-rich CWC family protein [Steroidobacteraceae bacterium]
MAQPSESAVAGRCPICHGANDCAMAAGAGSAETCWCRREPVARLPAGQPQASCLCPRCLDALEARHARA